MMASTETGLFLRDKELWQFLNTLIKGTKTMANLPIEQHQALQAARQVLSQERAHDIRRLMSWKHGGCLCLGATRPDIADVTPDEDAAIRQLWDTLPGSSCWMSALLMLCRQ